MKTSVFTFCVMCHLMPFTISLANEIVELEDNPDRPRKSPTVLTDKRYLTEIALGDMADLFSTNIHQAIPSSFTDLGRRFVPQYPYSEKTSAQIDEEAEERLDNIIQEAIKNSDYERAEDKMIPIKAPAHIVLAIAKQSVLLQKSDPVRQPDEFLQKQALRNGDYWNSFWKEEVSQPELNLRSNNNLESVRVKIMPGSKLYKLISITKDLSPKLLYVINNKDEDE